MGGCAGASQARAVETRCSSGPLAAATRTERRQHSWGLEFGRPRAAKFLRSRARRSGAAITKYEPITGTLQYNFARNGMKKDQWEIRRPGRTERKADEAPVLR